MKTCAIAGGALLVAALFLGLGCATFHAPPGGPGASLVTCYHLRDLPDCGVVSVDYCRSIIEPRIEADPAVATCLDRASTCEDADACVSGVVQ